jgi:tetratricopeptide (TPR) repeat protein
VVIVPGNKKMIFLSYRRRDEAWAHAVYEHLSGHGYDVFLDSRTVTGGPLKASIVSEIRRRAHFVVLLTPSALRRCTKVGDWLRLEIETAIESHRNIVPLLFCGFDFAAAALQGQLTEKLSRLPDCRGLKIDAEYFAEGMARLRQRLKLDVRSTIHPALPTTTQGEGDNAHPRGDSLAALSPDAAPPAREHPRSRAWTLYLSGAMLGALVVIALDSGRSPPSPGGARVEAATAPQPTSCRPDGSYERAGVCRASAEIPNSVTPPRGSHAPTKHRGRSAVREPERPAERPPPAAPADEEASSLYLQGRYAEAIAAWQQMYVNGDDRPELLLQIAEGFERVGDRRAAIQLYKSYLRRSSDGVRKAEVARRLNDLESSLVRPQSTGSTSPSARSPTDGELR